LMFLTLNGLVLAACSKVRRFKYVFSPYI